MLWEVHRGHLVHSGFVFSIAERLASSSPSWRSWVVGAGPSCRSPKSASVGRLSSTCPAVTQTPRHLASTGWTSAKTYKKPAMNSSFLFFTMTMVSRGNYECHRHTGDWSQVLERLCFKCFFSLDKTLLVPWIPQCYIHFLYCLYLLLSSSEVRISFRGVTEGRNCPFNILLIVGILLNGVVWTF